MSASPKISMTPEVKAILEKSTAEGNILRLPPGQLERKLYEAVNKHLTAAGGKWKPGKTQAHVFPEGVNALEAIGLAVTAGHSINKKTLSQAFYTPDALARKLLVEHADIQPHHRFLEPSVGGGAFLRAAIMLGIQPHLTLAIDINQEAITSLDEIVFKDFTKKTVPAFCTDFLAIDRLPFGFDRIAMNPPFAKDQDVKHVRHAFRFLRPQGRLIAIVGGNTNRLAFHKLLCEVWDAKALTHFEPLPDGSFKESGTSVNTALLTIRRP